jgi:dimethylaniline monooxygenase (N-oxide forming)
MSAPMDTVSSKKHILVVGCGASGLAVMRQLTQRGHTASCFDTLPCLGGVYAKSYENTILTTSSLLTAFSDYSDGKEDQPKFWTDTEYLAYLKDFAEKYDLLKNVQFRTSVEKVQKCAKTGKWRAWIKGNRTSPPHRVYGEVPAEDPNEPTVEVGPFDGICICTGTNTWACRPAFPGEDVYKGRILHSELYKRAKDFEGQRVLVVGAGESASDICNEISMHAKATGMNIRGKHGHLIPRKQSDGRVTDLNTNRCRYSNPYILGDWIGWATQVAKRFIASVTPATDETKVLRKIGELNMQQGTSAFSKFGCKNAGFVEAVVHRGATLHRGSFELREHSAVFTDGSEFEADVILACTGYRNTFPFVCETHPDINEFGQNPRWLYKQVFHPNYGGEVAFFGFARPAFGSIPPTSEMQARFFAMVVNGEITLPCKKDMVQSAAKDEANWEWRFGYDKTRVKGLVDFQLYCDDLASQMGVLPPLRKLFLTNPRVWFKIMFGPFTMHQYRIQGPAADPQRAQEVYKKLPVGDLLESSITASFLFAAKILSLLGFSMFRPNNF